MKSNIKLIFFQSFILAYTYGIRLTVNVDLEQLVEDI